MNTEQNPASTPAEDAAGVPPTTPAPAPTPPTVVLANEPALTLPPDPYAAPAPASAPVPAPAPAGAPVLAAAAAPDPAPVATAPRTRWAGIIWGLLFAAMAGAGIWLLTDTARHDAIADWVMTLTPSTIGGLGVLVVGVLILTTGAIGLIRHAQRRYAARRA